MNILSITPTLSTVEKEKTLYQRRVESSRPLTLKWFKHFLNPASGSSWLSSSLTGLATFHYKQVGSSPNFASSCILKLPIKNPTDDSFLHDNTKWSPWRCTASSILLSAHSLAINGRHSWQKTSPATRAQICGCKGRTDVSNIRKKPLGCAQRCSL